MLTTKELLKPRYLITAEDTSGNLKKGQILVLDEEAGAFWCGKTCYTDDQLKQWPHLFQPLEWWQEIKPEDMPEYVKQHPTNRIGSNAKFFVIKVYEWSDDGTRIIFKEGGGLLVDYIIPATENEYLQYTKNPKDDTGL